MIGLFKRYVLHNFWLKVLSLLLAAGLWWRIAPDEQPAVVVLHSPIVFQHVPQHLEISTDFVPDAQIRVRGPERVIRQLQSNEVQAEIDLSEAKAGERTFDLTSQQVRHPSGIRIVQVVPSQVHLAFDTRLTREVEIRPRVTVADDERIVKMEVDPPMITITGPRHHVESVDAAITDPIDAAGAKGVAVFSTNVYVSDQLVQVVRPLSIQVTVMVQKAANNSSN
jgi:YbbR domain-containing protein